MNESMMVEAVRAAHGVGFDPVMQAQNTEKTANPSAVERFQAALAPNAANAPDAVPFASEVGAMWDVAKSHNQEILHRIKALSSMATMDSSTSLRLMELQYEVMNLSFHQDVVTKIADKASTAVQTLIKNQ